MVEGSRGGLQEKRMFFKPCKQVFVVFEAMTRALPRKVDLRYQIYRFSLSSQIIFRKPNCKRKGKVDLFVRRTGLR